MKNLFVAAIFILVLGCQNKTTDGEPQMEPSNEAADAVPVSPTPVTMTPHPMIDSKGQLMAVMTLPSDWHIHTKGKAAFTGPNDVFVFAIPARSFVFSSDPMMAQALSGSGVRMRKFVSAKEVIQQDFVPIATREGSKLLRIYDAPQIARADEALSGMMYTIGPRQNRYEAVVSEWEDKDGKPYAIILRASSMGFDGTFNWMYSGQLLYAPEKEFKSALQTLTSGLASLKYNPRYFDEYNRKEMNRESASWAAHNQRMASQQRSFDLQQQAFRERTDAVNKSIMASYESRAASSDKIHNRFLNYIKDETTVANPADGKRYQVESGADQYWMNSDGQYIGSNNLNYDPNRDPETNSRTWSETEIAE